MILPLLNAADAEQHLDPIQVTTATIKDIGLIKRQIPGSLPTAINFALPSSQPSAISSPVNTKNSAVDDVLIWGTFVLIAFFIPLCMLRYRRKIEACLERWKRKGSKDLPPIILTSIPDSELTLQQQQSIEMDETHLEHVVDHEDEDQPLPIYTKEWDGEVGDLSVLNLVGVEVDGVQLGIISDGMPTSPTSPVESLGSNITSSSPPQSPDRERTRYIMTLPSYEDLLSTSSITIPRHLIKEDDPVSPTEDDDEEEDEYEQDEDEQEDDEDEDEEEHSLPEGNEADESTSLQSSTESSQDTIVDTAISEDYYNRPLPQEPDSPPVTIPRRTASLRNSALRNSLLRRWQDTDSRHSSVETDTVSNNFSWRAGDDDHLDVDEDIRIRPSEILTVQSLNRNIARGRSERFIQHSTDLDRVMTGW
ncbi:hypothetical protein SmJEL517_g03935 [Synchytrium microbalum]|uniref:Uncharacterized protein n=1 Tax=Synchytrium microbalum TaxID=1806994 RepID=A0A507C097_9FUNG|nr:uncharacterized protein SmJEL517_g03935 [Synchytrium microbalum]TPX33112.1 hypothetical protein SmJEL517_g03935 [Synchytrium microbalum]